MNIIIAFGNSRVNLQTIAVAGPKAWNQLPADTMGCAVGSLGHSQARVKISAGSAP